MQTSAGFHMGCAIWAYKPWVGNLYPPGSSGSNFLHLYSRRFTAVEGNTTFYSVPSEAMVQRWLHETPSTFQFCLKLPQTITHQGSLMAKIAETMAFLERIAPLDARLGPILAQLPPSYGPRYFNDLVEFLTQFPRQRFPITVEVRHIDWFQSEHSRRLNHAFTQLGVGRALLDSRPMYECENDPQVRSQRRKPRVPLQPITTAPFSIIRYISHPTLENNHRYLNEWVAHVSQWLQQGINMYFFVHCPEEVRSPSIARYFQSQLDQTGLAIPPLPWNSAEQQPTQLSLF